MKKPPPTFFTEKKSVTILQSHVSRKRNFSAQGKKIPVLKKAKKNI